MCRISKLLCKILRRKANWIGHILKTNSLLQDAIEGKITGVNEVGRRRKQLLGDLRNKRRYCEVKEEAEDRERWKIHFINRIYGGNASYLLQIYGPTNKHYT